MKLKTEYIVFFVILAVFLILKINSLSYAISDENTYYLMGKLVSEGQVMYKDFFFSHPPFQILLFAFLTKVFGFNFFILKATSTIAIIIAAFFIFEIIKERIGRKESIIGAALFLFSYDTLRFSSFPTGVNLTVMFTIISFYFLLNKKILAAGIFIGMAAITGLYSLITAAVFFSYMLWKQRDGLLKFITGFFVVFGTVNLIFFLLAGGSYFMQVYLYHLLKPASAIDKADIIIRIFTANILLWLSMLLFIFTDRKLKKEVFISIAVVFSYFAFFILSKNVFAYYMMMAFPFAALLGAYSIMSLRTGMSRRAVFLIACSVLLVSLFFSASRFLSYDYQNFNEADEIAKYIQENSKKEDKIFGDESITPLLSILSGRGIALNFIDSNALRFKSGITDVNATISRLKGNLKFFIAYRLDVGKGKISYGLVNLPEFEKFVKENCKEARVFRAKWQEFTKEYYIYDCEQS